VAIPEVFLKAAVEEAAGCSAYPVDAGEGSTPPYVVYSRSATSRDVYTTGGVGWAVGTFSLEIYADSYTQAKELADACSEALHNFSGQAEAVTIDVCYLTDEKDGTPVFLDGRESPTYLVEHTYSIRWQE